MSKKIMQRVSAAWRHWERCSEVVYDRKMAEKLKGNIYKTMLRPALLYVATTKGHEARLEVIDMRMLRWMYAVTKKDRIKNEYFRRTTRVKQVS